MIYRRLQEALAGEDRPQFAVNFASGVAAAFAATLLTQPADVVRTRMQLNLGTGAAAAAAGAAVARGPGGALAASLGAWGTMAAALRNEGPAALMTGGCGGLGLGLRCGGRRGCSGARAAIGPGTLRVAATSNLVSPNPQSRS